VSLVSAIIRSRHSSLPSAIRRRRIGRRSRVGRFRTCSHSRNWIGWPTRICCLSRARLRSQDPTSMVLHPSSKRFDRECDHECASISVRPIASPDLPATLAPPAPALPKQDQSLGDESSQPTRVLVSRGPTVRHGHRHPPKGRRGSPALRSDGKATVRAALAANLDGLGLRRMTTPDDVKLHHTSQGGV
jgi:hypothetical protein